MVFQVLVATIITGWFSGPAALAARTAGSSDAPGNPHGARLFENAGAPRGRAQAPKPAAAGPTLVLETVKGTIEIETYPDDAPKTVARIVELVKRNFYNGQRFHRIEKSLVQIGDPVSRDMSREAHWGRTGSGTSIGVAEITKRRRHVAGAVAMAHAGDPKYADSQFYITKRAAPEFDGKYTVFGRVVRGLDVVAKLEKADILKRVSVKP